VTESNSKTLKEYGRGIIGGLLFSLPLIYTMEVWWTGFIAPPEYLLSCIVGSYLLLLGYNRYAGMKEGSSFAEICWDSVEEIGLAFIVSFLFLLLINRIDFGMSLNEIAGKVIVESMIVAIGISVGTAQLGGNNGEEEKNGKEEKSPAVSKKREDKKNSSSFPKRTILAVCGSVLVASAVAPTEEILMIAASSNNIHLLLMVFISLLITGVTLYYSDFKKTSKTKPATRVMLQQITVDYSITLLVCFLLLWFFGRVRDYNYSLIVAQIVVLGIPGALGASAGRLLIGK